MPTKQIPVRATDLDIDLAMLGEPLDGDSLDALSSVLDTRDAIAEMSHLIAAVQRRLEAGEPAYAVFEEHAFDLDQLADIIHVGVGRILG